MLHFCESIKNVKKYLFPEDNTFSDVAAMCERECNTSRQTNVVLMLVERRRRWTNIKTTLGKRLVYPGYLPQIIGKIGKKTSCLTAVWITFTP